jgi:hypothetical protein
MPLAALGGFRYPICLGEILPATVLSGRDLPAEILL